MSEIILYTCTATSISAAFFSWYFFYKINLKIEKLLKRDE